MSFAPAQKYMPMISYTSACCAGITVSQRPLYAMLCTALIRPLPNLPPIPIFQLTAPNFRQRFRRMYLARGWRCAGRATHAKLAIPHLQNEPPEKYASSTQSSPVSAVIPQLGSAAVSLHVMLKRALEGWKMALPSRPPTRFPRSQANSIPPRAPRRARTHARYVRNILNIILDLLRRQRETAALLEARAAARCLSGSQCLPKREGHASFQTATSKFFPPTSGGLRACRAS